MNLVWETNKGGGEAVYIILLFGGCFIFWRMSVGGGGPESLIRIFIPGFAQGNEDAGSVQLLPLFSLFQEPSTITKVMEGFFGVKANKDIEDMDLCDFTQDTSSTPAPPPPEKSQRLHSPF